MKYLFKAALGVLVTLVSACSSDEFIEEQTEVKQITMTASDFKYEQDSRTILTPGAGGAEFTWAENDTVGIFPDKGRQVDFSMKAGAGTKTASFSGGGWALKPASTYAAYYPMQGKFYLDKTAIPVSYRRQKQTSNASSSHLGQYDFMAAKATTPTEGNVSFGFKHLGCIVRFIVTLPKDVASIPHIALIAKKNSFITEGTIDLTAATPSIKAVTTDKAVGVTLENVSINPESKTITAYMMMAPADLSGETLEVYADGYTASVTGANYVAGHAYSYKVSLTKSVEPSHLWVDLGLESGTKWASFNLGATVPEEYGDYFAWGEIAPKVNYNNSTSDLYGKPMGSIEGNATYDAATAILHTPAQLPTKADIEELIKNTTQEKSVLNGVEGFKLTSKIKGNNNSIFIPAAGNKMGRSVRNVGTMGYYWTATPEVGNNDNSFNLYFNMQAVDQFQSSKNSRYLGMPIRPVRKN